jgi:alkanesulfonate monooxygenase SsuD/methylene tetrahydromethanopterin reductase-like flavin-dependent oxidoreductase (luciferase family)
VPDGSDWRIVKYVHVAGSDAEARARVFSEQSAYRYAFGYLYEVLKRADRLAALKSHPGQGDHEMTIESIIDGRVIHGSAQTVAEKIDAFRRQAGPFGTLLVTGMDWSGPNAAWERESMQRLSEEVMPLLRQPARAAE